MNTQISLFRSKVAGRLLLNGAVLCAFWHGGVQAQIDSTGFQSPQDTLQTASLARHPVVFADDTVFFVYSPLGEFDATERSNQITQRLRALARNQASLQSLRIVENEGVTDVLLDTLRVFSVTGADARMEGKEREILAEEYRSKIQSAIAERRDQLSLRGILTDIGLILISLVALLLLFWIMRSLFPNVYPLVESWENRFIPTIRFRSQEILKAETIASVIIIILKGIRLAISLGALYIFLIYVFSIIPWTQSWDPAPLLKGILFSILITAAAIALMRGSTTFYRRISGRIEGWKGTLINPVRVKTIEVLSEDRIADLLRATINVLQFATILFVAYFYVTLIFSFFEFSATWAATLFGYILDPVRSVVLSFIQYLPNVFFIAVIVFVTRYLLKFIHLFFTELQRGTISIPGFYSEWAEPTYKIARFLVIAFAAIVIFPYLPGSESPAFQGVSVFLGILFSLGSTSAIANVVAGIVLTYMRPFKIGDRVKIAETIGDVVEKTLLVTRLRTVKNVDVTIPNAMVLGSHIINFSSSAVNRGLVLHTTVTIGYNVPWKQVHDLLIKAAQTTERILKEPDPFVLQKSLDDSSVAYELNVYTDQPSLMNSIYSDLHQNIQDTFNAAGVEIMSPHFTSVRDGNTSTIPEDYLPKSYQAPAFRIFPVGGKVSPEKNDNGPKPE